MRISISTFITVTALAALVSCSSNPYRYVPAENQATNTMDTNEALYELPQNNPSGTLRVQYIGIEKSMLHLRAIASNAAATGSWELDSSSFFVSFPDGTKTQPASAQPSKITVPPGSLLGMDLYFALPPNLHSSDKLAEFDLHWQIQAEGQDIAETTAFDRARFPELHNGFYDVRSYPAYPASYDSDAITGTEGGWWG